MLLLCDEVKLSLISVIKKVLLTWRPTGNPHKCKLSAFALACSVTFPYPQISIGVLF